MEEVENIRPYGSDGEGKTEQVRDMFDSIAPAYDLMNSLMSVGMHRRWLHRAVEAASEGSPNRILDVATGTGDVAIALAQAMPRAEVCGIDLSEGMIERGRRKVAAAGLDGRIALSQADCLALPFADNSFDVVTVAYGVRNFEHLDRGYAEMLRVLRPGGKLVVIELTTPRSAIVKPFYRFYTRCIIPAVGRMVSRDVRAYSYLPESIAAVPQREAMCELMERCGFVNATWRTFTMGVCAMYVGEKQ